MAEFPDLAFKIPPIAEVGFTVMTERGAMDNYDVRGLHDLFIADFPTVSRQGVVDIFAQPAVTELSVEDPLFRWWFTSKNEVLLLQFQEDMIARNWRRVAPFPDQIEPYPGYAQCRDNFVQQVEIARKFRESAGQIFPNPIGGELFYDNHIPLVGPDGERIRFHDVLGFLNFKTSYKMAGFNTIWVEPIESKDEVIGDLIVRSALGAVGRGEGEQTPVLRLILTARFKHGAWDGIFERFDVAHAYTRTRFVELTTDERRATWGML